MPSYALGQARALMGLSAQLEEELDFREGDVITIVGIPEPGWFEGELGGHRGIFPEGFVELLGPLKANAEVSKSSDNHSVNGVKDMYRNTEEKAWSDSEEELPGPYGIALYQFQALESAELDFEVGDRIRILGVLEDGWLEGELQGRRGIFPHRFVRLEESSPQPQEKWVSEHPTKVVDSEAVTIQKEDPSALMEELGWDLVCAEKKPGVLSVRHEGPSDMELKQTETLNHQNDVCLESLSSSILGSPLLDSAKAVNGVSSIPPPLYQPKNQHCSQINNPDSSLSLRPSWSLSENHSASEWDEDVQSRSQKSVSVCEELATCRDVQRWKPKSRSSSFSGTHEGLDTWPVWRGTRTDRSQGVLHGESCGDLDSKLTEQLTQFEQSLAGASSHANYGTPQQDNVSRHFSILGFSSEKDIVRGSVEHSSQRRKVLRPPPPRPSTPASATLRLPARHSPKVAPPQNLPISVRPSRPAPLPPSGNLRKSPASTKLHSGSKEGQSSPDESRGASPCSFLMNRIKELEQELDVYRKTRAELSVMLEQQPQGELGQDETMENLDFCDCKMSSLSLELQELRGE